MQKPPLRTNAALRRIKAGEVLNVYVTGNWATPRHIDFVCRSGLFDVLWFDLEHFDLPTDTLATLNMVARAYPVTTIARIKANDYQTVMRTLETGVDGIMCAMVADAAEARQIVEWSRFNDPNAQPGQKTGNRGWNSGNIDGGYANIPPLEYVQNRNAETIVLCQIEFPDALEQVEEIVAVPGVDGLFFGPGDYSCYIGRPGQIAHAEVDQAMARVAAAVKKEGKWWGTVSPGRELYARAKSLGGQFLCPGGDVKVMNLGLQGLWNSFQEAETPSPAQERAKY